MSKKLTHEEFLQRCEEKNVLEDVEILEEYINNTTKISCKCKKCGKILKINPKNLLQGQSCRECKIKAFGKRRRLTQKDFLERFENNGRKDEIKIVGEYTGLYNKIKCWCKKGNHYFYTTGYSLLEGHGCFQCSYSNRKDSIINKSYNDFLHYIEDNNLHLVLLENYRQSNVKIKFLCLDCNNEWIDTPSKIKQGKRCPFCNDGFSFPNKIIRILFSVLKLKNYSFEYIIKDSKYRYDAFFMNGHEKILVEMDGEQHKKRSKNSNWATLEEQQKIDKEKDKLAFKNNYILIRIPCPNNDKDIIKNIQESRLKDYLDFSKVNWDEVITKAKKSILKEVCYYFVNHPNATKEKIRKKFKISDTTIELYIKTGKELNIIPKNQKFKNFLGRYNPEIKQVIGTKPIGVYSIKDTNNLIHIFCSQSDCIRYYKQNYNVWFKSSELSKVLKNQKENYKGLYFKYITNEELVEYEHLIREVDKSIIIH